MSLFRQQRATTTSYRLSVLAILTCLLGLLTLVPSFCSPAMKTSITISTDMPTNIINPLFFGHSVVFSDSSIWNSQLQDLDAEVAVLFKSLSPTIVRFPGGSYSDLYIWEDALGYRTTAPAVPTDSSIILDGVPHWGTVQKARFIDSMGGQFGDPFNFVRLNDNQLEGVAGLRVLHPAGGEVRPDARAGQPDWITNTYGSDEQMQFVHSLSAQALFTVNYGTGLDSSGQVSTTASLSQRVKRAAAWVSYLNGNPSDTRPLGIDAEGTDWQTIGYWAQKRTRRGHSEPYKVQYWEIGNEVYGKWEAGFTTARQYAADFREFVAAMKAVDRTIKVGAVGLSTPHGHGDADGVDEWNTTIVRTTSDVLDFLVLHLYYPSADKTEISYTSTAWFTAVMAGAQQAAKDLQDIRALLTANSPRAAQVEITVTEYGIWPADSTVARDYSNLARALYDADLLLQLLQRGEQLGVSLATAWNLHGSNETAAIGYNWSTGTRTLRPSYYAFRLVRSSVKQQQVRTRVTSPSFRTNRVANVESRSGIPLLTAAATTNDQKDKVNLLVLNRSLTEAIATVIRLESFVPASVVQIHTLYGPSIGAHNEDGVPTVGMVTSQFTEASSAFTYAFPSHSLTSLEFSAQAH